MSENWLAWVQQMQGIAQAGLAYSKDKYDIERFEQLRELSKEILLQYTKVDANTLDILLAGEVGYPTPKVAVRAVVFQENKILMVQEEQDGLWSLPGGWADVGLSPREVVVKEVKEEAGIEVEPVRLLAVFDQHHHDHPPSFFHIYNLYLLCEVKGGELKAGMETLDVQYCEQENLPPLSVKRVTKAQIDTFFRFLENPNMETIVD
ncbi:NUDIX hydrolase [Priestia endophytica]|uniref:NUDIX hydrolase n=1 Tax=Priestia filamentosa TaxID=1402861 RepID=UPI002E23B931|nr:NUDIX hydrolase [Priestia filamentosa]